MRGVQNLDDTGRSWRRAGERTATHRRADRERLGLKTASAWRKQGWRGHACLPSGPAWRGVALPHLHREPFPRTHAFPVQVFLSEGGVVSGCRGSEVGDSRLRDTVTPETTPHHRDTGRAAVAPHLHHHHRTALTSRPPPHTLKPVPPSSLHLVHPHRPPPPPPPPSPGGHITGVDDDASRNQQGAEGPHYLARRPASAAPRVTGAANPHPPSPAPPHLSPAIPSSPPYLSLSLSSLLFLFLLLVLV
ncbi:hypothetical protein E2C01_013309 [Portunus trituberculatus]|uniref:Uncharacterized protein n=1 Tax=Portunus trituberculatus TaxID=210409 RepID=A0A5B7DGR0_PORTR|nr:hypothetical protein [Portunus trituberculatus]